MGDFDSNEDYLPAKFRSSAVDENIPVFPDGSTFDEVRDDPEKAKICRDTLVSFNKAYQFGPEHTLSLRLILHTLTIYLDLVKSEDAKLLERASKLADDMMKYQKDMGLLRKTGSGYDPFTLWDQHVSKKSIPYMREHGLGTTVACPECGTMVLPYIFSLPVACAKCGEPVFYKGFKHPWINWERYPIWSSQVWTLVQAPCGHKCHKCGAICTKPKLTREEAAYILDMSEPGFDQLEQSWIDGTPVRIGPDGELVVDEPIKTPEEL